MEAKRLLLLKKYKSQGLGLFLTGLFGGLGLFYASILWGVAVILFEAFTCIVIIQHLQITQHIIGIESSTFWSFVGVVPDYDYSIYLFWLLSVRIIALVISHSVISNNNARIEQQIIELG